MNSYGTLNHEVFYIKDLPKEHKKLFQEAEKYFQTKPSWDEFHGFWAQKINGLLKEGIRKRDIIDAPIYKIFQDMESRLGIEQGCVRNADYRDRLAEIISEEFSSRYQFCKKAQVDEAFLANVLKKKKDFSIKKLEKILEDLGYELEIKKKCA